MLQMLMSLPKGKQLATSKVFAGFLHESEIIVSWRTTSPAVDC